MTEARPPAAAYAEVAEILGEEYFAAPPPEVGFTIEVVGVDGKPTYWDMDEPTRQRLSIRLDRSRHQLRISAPYDRRQDTP